MVSSRFGINFIFACVVILLALIAATSFYKGSYRPAIPSFAAPEAPSRQLPPDQSLDDKEKQLEHLQQLAAEDPQSSDYATQIGNLYYDLGHYDNAVEYYERSLTIHPQDPNVETDLATCYHYLGRDDKALEILDNVLHYSPGFTQAMFNKGIVLINGKKNVKDGIAVWEDLLRSHPDYPHRTELEQRILQLKDPSKSR